MTRRIEDFSGLHPLDEYPAHFLSFTNGGRPPEEIQEIVHAILKDVNDEKARQGIVDMAIARGVGGPAVLAIVDHSPTRSEIYRLRQQRVRAEETFAA